MNNKKSNSHLFPYEWYLKDGYPAKGIEKHNKKVFSCFACGGGSTMGYKLAGYDVIGCNEIDPKMIKAYRENHKPKYSYLEPIQTFKLRNDLPKELYNLDLLDGSPPCSSFSTAGNREKDWGKDKKFREGQTKQVLDTLFFDFIDLAEKLQPKVVIAENVKGIILGKANLYVNKIRKNFNKAGYIVQDWLFNSKNMGVPQRRERVFFIALRKDLAKPFLYRANLFDFFPKINFCFKEKEIPFGIIQDNDKNRKSISNSSFKRWEMANKYGVYDERARGGKKFGFFRKLVKWRVAATLLSGGCYCIEDLPKEINKKELCIIGSYPLDYNFLNNKVQYLIGMSVPPVMTAQIANQVYKQWLSKL